VTLTLYSPLVEVDLSLLAHHVGEAATNTLDGGHGVWHLVATIDVGVKNTQNVLELVLRKDESHLQGGRGVRGDPCVHEARKKYHTV